MRNVKHKQKEKEQEDKKKQKNSLKTLEPNFQDYSHNFKIAKISRKI